MTERKRGSTATLVFVVAAAAAADVKPPSSPAIPSPPPPYGHYGPAEAAEVWQIAAGMWECRPVRTRGLVSPLDTAGDYFELSEGGRIVLTAVPEFRRALTAFVGRRIEVTGLVRQCWRPDAPPLACDTAQAPDLPPPPAQRQSWPRVSLTAWSVADVTPFDRAKRDASSVSDVLGAAAADGNPITVAGRFCGANLCGGLGAPPAPGAWALADEDSAIWVIGKEPSGKGWRLDPRYAGDTSRWLQVVGRVEACGATRCLRAKSVALVPRPGSAAGSPAP